MQTGRYQASRWCPHCRSKVMAELQAMNHLPHMVLTALTLGLYLPIYALVTLMPGTYRCSRCGTKV